MPRRSADAPARPIRGRASFDRSRRYRYALVREWDPAGRRVAFVMLNPNRAGARRDDPTIRRCVGFARAWGFGSLEVVNLFARCAPTPRALRRARDPVGPRNDAHIRAAARRADRVVLAWGNHGALLDRSAAVRRLLGALSPLSFGATKRGEPRHPLYLPARAGALPVDARGFGSIDAIHARSSASTS